MSQLHRLLPDHNWYMLRAIAYTHRRSFDSQSTKSQAIDRVVAILTDPRTVQHALSALSDTAHEALQTLVACDGEIPAHRFFERFGPIRPFRPWRRDTPTAPWRNPASSAEQLWFFGFIFLCATPRGKMIVIPDEIRSFLPIAPTPAPAKPRRAALPTPEPILDLAHLLAYLQCHDLKPFAKRWLTPRHLRAINLGLAHADPTIPDARSELQTGYLSFLHYLAEASGLVDVVAGLLKPLPLAWLWLDASEAHRWRILWDGWQADLRQPTGQDPLWKRYRLPAQPTFVTTLFASLASPRDQWSPEAANLDTPALTAHLRRRCIGAGTLPADDDVLTPLQELLSGPFHWCRIVEIDSLGNLALSPQGAWLLELTANPPEMPPTEPATIHDHDHELVVDFPPPPLRPPLRPMVALALPAKDRLGRYLTRHRFVSLLTHGLDAAVITQALSVLTAQTLPPPIIQRLNTWEEQARGLSLRRLTVLTVADTHLLGELFQQPRIRDLCLETLSRHHIAVDPHQIESLLRALRRSGHLPLVEPGTVSSPQPDETPIDVGAAAHLWLALRTYLDLCGLIHLPSVPPVALLDQLQGMLAEDQLASLTSMAADFQRRLCDLVDGYAPFPSPLPGVDHTAIEEIVEDALEDAQPLRIVYHTAGRGERTERLVEPLRLDERGGARYLIAYCHLRQQERVFRLDRIEAAAKRGEQ